MIRMIVSGPARSLVIATIASAAACSSSPAVDPRELQNAENAIEAARQAGSERHAGETLREAEQRLMLVKTWIDAGRTDDAIRTDAIRTLEQARVLAERAAAESVAEQTVRAAEAVGESLSSLEAILDVNLPETE